MKNKKGLINKIKLLLNRAKAPKYLHRFGPKTYELRQHIFALFVKSYCQLSYRSTAYFLRQLGFIVATKSTLQRYAAKLSLPFWQTLFNKTVSTKSSIGAIDSTGLEKSKASLYYTRRIDSSKKIKRYFQLSVLSLGKKIVSLRLRSNPCHDAKNVKYLFSKAKKHPSTVLMDKAYDAEWIHEYFADNGIRSIAPVRKNWRKGFYRKKLAVKFPQKLYNKRSRVESLFHSFKQKYGSSISSKLANTARSEIYCKSILYNLFIWLCRLLGQSWKINNYLK
ncbi:MAG: transposase [Nanoarchaeota archaeon]|nr:transposase [Nanoarchaeota archaeon]